MHEKAFVCQFHNNSIPNWCVQLRINRIKLLSDGGRRIEIRWMLYILYSLFLSMLCHRLSFHFQSTVPLTFPLLLHPHTWLSIFSSAEHNEFELLSDLYACCMSLARTWITFPPQFWCYLCKPAAKLFAFMLHARIHSLNFYDANEQTTWSYFRICMRMWSYSLFIFIRSSLHPTISKLIKSVGSGSQQSTYPTSWSCIS